MTTSNRPTGAPGSSLRPIEARDLDGLQSAGYDYGAFGDDLSYYEDGYVLSWGDRIRAAIGRQLVRVGWLVLAAGLAFGSAGITAATQHSPVSGSRPELTWGADQELSTKLDAAVRDLALLSDDVDLLGQNARKALTSLAQVNQVSLTAAWDGGSNAVNSIDSRAADLTKRLSCDPWDAAREQELSKTYSAGLIDRYHHVCLAITSIAPLHDDWASLVAGSRTAMQVATDINDHDTIAADALQLATQGRYPEALTKLAGAATAIADATSIADTLAKTTDVSTLQDWLTRTTRMDDALGVLWQAVIDSGGRITPQVTAALKNESDAKALLPNDTSVLQVVLGELAGSLTADGISIETAKGALADALHGLVGDTVFGA
jgi:hypothetical protein